MKQALKFPAIALLGLAALATVPTVLAARDEAHLPYGVPDALNRLAPLFGEDAAAYWAAAPRSFVTFLICTTTFLPLLALLTGALTNARASKLDSHLGEALRRVAIAVGVNLAHHVACMLTLLGAGLALSTSWPWTIHAFVASTLGAAPYLALGTLCASSFSRRRWKLTAAIGSAVFLHAGSQVLIYSKLGVFLLPTFALRNALSTHADDIAMAVLTALCWLAASVGVAHRVRRRQARPTLDPSDKSIFVRAH